MHKISYYFLWFVSAYQSYFHGVLWFYKIGLMAILRERSKIVGIDEKLLKSNLPDFSKRVLLD